MSKWIQTADWKSEKHVPVIEVEKKGDNLYHVHVSVGKEIPHPNTTAHHIRWINLWFWPDGEKFPLEIGYATFDHHGESAKGADTSTIYADPIAMFAIRTERSGVLMATSFCNIHGLWKSEVKLTV